MIDNKNYEKESAFTRSRITELRKKNSVSELKMSLDLGHSKGYVHNIVTGKALPSMLEFFRICDYLGVSIKDFYETYDAETSQLLHGVNEIFDEHIDELMCILEGLKESRKIAKN